MAVYKNENGELVDYTKSNTIKPDPELSPTSENPVQNKTITAELKNKVNKTDVDVNVLAKISESDDGTLLYKGEEITGGSSIIISETQPTGQKPGDLWFVNK